MITHNLTATKLMDVLAEALTLATPTNGRRYVIFCFICVRQSAQTRGLVHGIIAQPLNAPFIRLQTRILALFTSGSLTEPIGVEVYVIHEMRESFLALLGITGIRRCGFRRVHPPVPAPLVAPRKLAPTGERRRECLRLSSLVC